MAEAVFQAPQRIDGVNAPAVQEELEKAVAAAVGAEELHFVVDMKETVYMSSAGLRVIGSAQKKVRAQGGTFALRHVCESIEELLEITGLTSFLTVEED